MVVAYTIFSQPYDVSPWTVISTFSTTIFDLCAVRPAHRMWFVEKDHEVIGAPLQVVWCENRRLQVATVRKTSTKLNQTDVINWSMRHRFSDVQLRDAGNLMWRQMSADAHVLGRSMFERGNIVHSDPRSGLGVLVTGGHLRHVAEPFVAIHLLLKEGWLLFDRLCEAQPAFVRSWTGFGIHSACYGGYSSTMTLLDIEALADRSDWAPFFEAARAAPTQPGVYMMRLADAGIVYVGMAGLRKGLGIRGRLNVYRHGRVGRSRASRRRC
jgi:hypothetical protein